MNPDLIFVRWERESWQDCLKDAEAEGTGKMATESSGNAGKFLRCGNNGQSSILYNMS